MSAVMELTITERIARAHLIEWADGTQEVTS